MDEQTYQTIYVIQIIVTKFAILFSHHLTLPPLYSSLLFFSDRGRLPVKTCDS